MPLARNLMVWTGAIVVLLAVVGACVDFVPAFRLADPKIAWACLGLALLWSLRALVLGRGAQVQWLRQRWPVVRWLGVLVLPWLLAPLLWIVAVRTLPWAWTRATGFPAQWHLPVVVARGPLPACATTIAHHRFHAWPHVLCVAAGAGEAEPGTLVRAELVGRRSVVGFAVADIRVRTDADPAAPEVEFTYDPAIEVERSRHLRDNRRMQRTLAQWLDYQQQVHPKSIDMGLERIGAVAARLRIARPARYVVTVGGTNGKGSTVAFIEAIARAQGLRVGAYTSPHLLRYNERVRIDGREVDDATLVAAFARIEAARLAAEPAVPLTYFEFGTLAALLAFAAADLDLAILEVGLGGRLDATNLVDADVAVITTVDIDHQDWLGEGRELIGAEKAGILRAGKPAVLAERDPPSSVLRRAYELGAIAIRGHSDYLVDVDADGDGWTWREPGYEIDLPRPVLAAPAQLDNAAAAIAALRALPIAIDDEAIRRGVAGACVPARLQVVAADPEIVVDVGHNPQAARELARWLERHPRATHAVFSALADKDIAAIGAILEAQVDTWHVAGVGDAGERGLSGAAVGERLAAAVPAARIVVHADVAQAVAVARAALAPGERLLVFGSFHTAADALRVLGE